MYSEIFDNLLKTNSIVANTCIRCITPISGKNLRTEHGCQECDRALVYIHKQRKLRGLDLPIQPTLNGNYDCVIGVSGGVDSSWLAVKLVEKGYKPICIHVDNGWNTRSASENVFNLTKYLNLDLHVRVLDWNEFSSLQKSFMAADVVDFELCSDHAIFSTLYQYSLKFSGLPIFQGINTATENTMPPGLIHAKHDAKHIRAIYSKFSNNKLHDYPLMSTLKIAFIRNIYKINWVSALDYMNYDKLLAEKELYNKFGYKAPVRKHEESLITKIYQRIILPIKFNSDKRIGHLSSLINSNLITRDEAIAIYSAPIYSSYAEIFRDIESFCGNLDITIDSFCDYLLRPPIPHEFYPSDVSYINFLLKIKNAISI